MLVVNETRADLLFLMFAAHLLFPKEYPLRPPRMKFVTEMWHPNIDQNGDGESLAISRDVQLIYSRFSLHKHPARARR